LAKDKVIQSMCFFHVIAFSAIDLELTVHHEGHSACRKVYSSSFMAIVAH